VSEGHKPAQCYEGQRSRSNAPLSCSRINAFYTVWLCGLHTDISINQSIKTS